MRKGQLSLFIILGILVLALLGIALLLSTRSSTDELDKTVQDIAVSSVPIQSYVDDCLESTLKDGVIEIGLQGGYYHWPDEFIRNLGFAVPIYHDSNKGDLMPSIETIEDQIMYYMIDNIDVCLSDFEVFARMGTVVTEGGREYDVTIFDDEVLVTMTDRILARSEGKTHQFNDFSARVPAAIGLMWDYARLYVDAQVQNPEEEPLGYLMRLAYEYDFRFETLFLDDTYVYALNKDMAGGDYVYAFAMRYDWGEAS